MIRVGDEWIPTSEALEKIRAATAAVDHLDRLNDDFPQLASEQTREIVPIVRQRLRDFELLTRQLIAHPDLGLIAIGLLATQSPETVLETLAKEHDVNINLRQLVAVAGEPAYLGALAREARELNERRVSSEQTARLWSEFGRPAAGGGLWSADRIGKLLTDGPAGNPPPEAAPGAEVEPAADGFEI